MSLKGGEVGVLEVSGEDGMLKVVVVLDSEGVTLLVPANHLCELPTLQ